MDSFYWLLTLSYRPCHHIPGVKVTNKIIETTDHNHERIEKAYKTYFYRADEPDPDLKDGPTEKHEFEIVVCHANVIRYFLMRYDLPIIAYAPNCFHPCLTFSFASYFELQGSSITTGSLVALLSIQLFIDVYHYTSHRKRELPHVW
jgi:hypothetical protein